jgi:hypothetical protein
MYLFGTFTPTTAGSQQVGFLIIAGLGFGAILQVRRRAEQDTGE